MRCQALEFFSGIGAFRLVAGEFGVDILSAYDQSDDAKAVYLHNFQECPRRRNLDTISAGEIPEASFWWLSPPCKPFSRRGKQADLDDPRARALINLIRLLPLKMPGYFAMENVLGFAGSRAESLLLKSLVELGYHTRKVCICPTDLGVPMQRPRLFYLASRNRPIPEYEPAEILMQPIANFINRDNDDDLTLRLDPLMHKKYGEGLNVVAPTDPQAKAICFTSGYSRSMNSSGSFIAVAEDGLRFFSPQEILALLGFPESFEFPADMPLSTRFRLAGNSIDLRSIRRVLRLLLP